MIKTGSYDVSQIAIERRRTCTFEDENGLAWPDIYINIQMNFMYPCIESNEQILDRRGEQFKEEFGL